MLGPLAAMSVPTAVAAVAAIGVLGLVVWFQAGGAIPHGAEATDARSGEDAERASPKRTSSAKSQPTPSRWAVGPADGEHADDVDDPPAPRFTRRPRRAG
jgi:hypothetical protein